jgi:predicted metal-dependent RNase
MELVNTIKKTIERKGKVLLPVLGSGRAQEIMVMLEKLMREGMLEKIPIYVQGMVWDITAIHTAYPDFLNSKVKRLIFHKDQNPFLSDIFKRVGSRKEMDEVIEEKGPCIVMSTAGMMTGGAIVEYFRRLADNARHSLVLTCYQAPGSLGRRLEEGEKSINFVNGNRQEVVEVKMEISIIKGFSGHSNRTQLINFIQNVDPRPKKVIMIHGESSKCLDLASTIYKVAGIETLAPKNLEAIRLR